MEIGLTKTAVLQALRTANGTLSAVAQQLGTSRDELAAFCRQHPELQAAYEQRWGVARDIAEQELIKQARAGKMPAIKTILDPTFNPRAQQTAVAPADPTAPPPFDLNGDVFQDSPLAATYYHVLNEMKERDGRKKAAHHRIALWVAWESHRVAATFEGEKFDLLAAVGLPKTQVAFAELVGVNPRTLRGYYAKYGHFVTTAQETAVSRVLAGYDIGVLHATGSSASVPDPRHASDRRLFAQLRGWLVEKQEVAHVSWQDEVIEALKKGDVAPAAVVEQLGEEVARPLLRAAGVEADESNAG